MKVSAINLRNLGVWIFSFLALGMIVCFLAKIVFGILLSYSLPSSYLINPTYESKFYFPRPHTILKGKPGKAIQEKLMPISIEDFKKLSKDHTIWVYLLEGSKDSDCQPVTVEYYANRKGDNIFLYAQMFLVGDYSYWSGHYQVSSLEIKKMSEDESRISISYDLNRGSTYFAASVLVLAIILLVIFFFGCSQIYNKMRKEFPII